MCWNQYVSINTFVFGIFVLLFIGFNNTYSNYKIEFFKNPYAYVFMFSVVLIQFVEFILWRNLNNYIINRMFSVFGLLLVCIQPVTSLLLITDIRLRNRMLMLYTIPAIVFLLYNVLTVDIHTTTSHSGYLFWKWTFKMTVLFKALVTFFYLFFLFFPLIYNKYYVTLFFLFVYFLIIYYFGKDGSSGSIWCLFANSLFLYFLFHILVAMPYCEITGC